MRKCDSVVVLSERACVGVAAGKLCHLRAVQIKAAENPRKQQQDSNMVCDRNVVSPWISGQFLNDLIT